VGDGTTSVVVLAGELLKEAEQLINQKIHPMTIISGTRCAAHLLQYEQSATQMLHNMQRNKSISQSLARTGCRAHMRVAR